MFLVPQALRTVSRQTRDHVKSGDVDKVLMSVRQDESLLKAKSFKTGNTIWHTTAKKGQSQVLLALLEHVDHRSTKRLQAHGGGFPASKQSLDPSMSRSRRVAFSSATPQAAGDISYDGSWASKCSQPNNIVLEHLNSLNESVQTPLHLAVINGHVECVKVLLANGASMEVADKCGKLTALHYAAMLELPDILEILLMECATRFRSAEARGNVVNARSAIGMTPLHFAVSGNNLHSVRLLLAHNADQHIVNEWTSNSTLIPASTRPLHIAGLKGYEAVAVELLKAHMSKPGSQDPRTFADGENRLPVYLAALTSGEDSLLVKMLTPGSDLQEYIAAYSDDVVCNVSAKPAKSASTSTTPFGMKGRDNQLFDGSALSNSSTSNPDVQPVSSIYSPTSHRVAPRRAQTMHHDLLCDLEPLTNHAPCRDLSVRPTALHHAWSAPMPMA